MLMSVLIERNLKGDLKDLFREFYRLADENFIQMCRLPNKVKFISPDTCLLRSNFNVQKIKDSRIKELEMFDTEYSVGYVWFIQVLSEKVDLWVKIKTYGKTSEPPKISLNGEGFVKSFYYRNEHDMSSLKPILEEFLNRLQFLKAVLLTD